MSQITKIVLLFVLSLGAISGHSQSLEELINTALANNYQIRILKNETAIAENMNTWGNAGLVPTIQLDGSFGASFYNTNQEFSNGTTQQGNAARTTSFSASLMANWTAFDGLAVYARKDQFEYLQNLGEINSKYYIDQTVADIVAAYYQLVMENLLLEKYRKSMEISKYRLNLEVQKKEVGAGLKIDYGQAEVAYRTDSILYLSQQNKIENLHLELNRLLNVDLETPLNVGENQDSFEQNIIPNRDTLKAQMQRNNQQLQAQQLEALISETNLRIAKANYYPKIDLFAGYQFSQNNAEVGFINLNQNYGPTMGINISYNLFNAGKTKTAVDNAKLEMENTTLDRKQIELDLNAEALSMYKQYSSLVQRVGLAKDNEATMKDVYQSAAQQLKEGEINGYDFRLVQLSLLNAEIKLLQLEFELKLVEINLNRIAGNILSVYM